mmetsp:Transcript_17637/g.41668  ORF Transcript_17637/g.41668 Transcript_17637/m.41668 type:complete len:229 (+) Transcript_17637:534-1220(+)
MILLDNSFSRRARRARSGGGGMLRVVHAAGRASSATGGELKRIRYCSLGLCRLGPRVISAALTFHPSNIPPSPPLSLQQPNSDCSSERIRQSSRPAWIILRSDRERTRRRRLRTCCARAGVVSAGAGAPSALALALALASASKKGASWPDNEDSPWSLSAPDTCASSSSSSETSRSKSAEATGTMPRTNSTCWRRLATAALRRNGSSCWRLERERTRGTACGGGCTGR